MTKSARFAQKRGGGYILDSMKSFVLPAVFLSIIALLVFAAGFTSGTGLTGALDALKTYGIVIGVIIGVIIVLLAVFGRGGGGQNYGA